MAEERIEGGGVFVAGAADRSVLISIGVGVRWGVVNHSGTLLCKQKIGNVQSPLLCVSVLMSVALSYTYRIVMLICLAIIQIRSSRTKVTPRSEETKLRRDLPSYKGRGTQT